MNGKDPLSATDGEMVCMTGRLWDHLGDKSLSLSVMEFVAWVDKGVWTHHDVDGSIP